MLVIHNAIIHTLDALQPLASAIAIDDDQIVAVGIPEDILPAYPSAQRFDAQGSCIIPGLIDAHIHLGDYAHALQKVDCETITRRECLSRVAGRLRQTAPGGWIQGHGWNQNNWAEGYGTATLLDEIAPHNPVYLTHKSLHCSWANTLALQLAGITRNTPDPPGGRIGRLPNGEPDGILYESADELMQRAIPEPSLHQVDEALRKALPLLNRMGLTGVHDFNGSRCFEALQILHASGELNLRVIKSLPFENLSRAIELGLRSGFGDGYLRIGSLKLFADGALGPHTAAMLQPYEAEPVNLGMLMLTKDQLFETGRLAVEHGIGLAVHAIGDRANREVLDGFARLRDFERGLPVLGRTIRHRIEHVQLVHPDDLPRFSALKIIASMQPIHATSDMAMADRGWGARCTYAYAWRSQLSNGAHLAFGSDAPVESPNPFWGIHAAVTRQRADASPAPDGWHPEQRLTVQEALHGFTTGAAYAAGLENLVGLIHPGFLADLLVLPDDPFVCDPHVLMQIRPLATMVGGRWVYSRL